jgi:hypothetical protein
MIITKTFKPLRSLIELRVYVPAMKAIEIEGHTDAAIDDMRNSLDVSVVGLPTKSNVTLCSNRAGLHYAHMVDCRSVDLSETHKRMEAVAERLKRAGWKESKGN